MKTPNKPLFIIDESQLHGRGTETQWVSCTSGSCPFIANVTMIDQSEYLRHYDKSDDLTAYSEDHDGIRMMVKVTNIATGYDVPTLRTLLRKLIKELMARKNIVQYNPENPSNEAVLKFIEIIQKQNLENLKADPTNRVHRDVFAILRKIHSDYEDIQHFNQPSMKP